MSLTPVPSLDQLAQDPAKASVLPLDATEKLLAQTHVVQGALLGRLLAARANVPAGGNDQAESSRDRLLSVKEVAQKLGLSEDHLYRHRDEYPFTVREGRRILFSERGIEDWIRRRQGQ